jgi:hypothetical protein
MPINEELNPEEAQDVKDRRRLTVAEQVAAFLATGGRITEVPMGETTKQGEDE